MTQHLYMETPMRTLFRSTLALTVLTFAGVAAHAEDAKAVIEKAVKAQGGEDTLKKFPAARVKAKGSMELMGIEIEFTLDASVQNPDKFRNDIHIEVRGQKITIVQVYNGKKGWQSMGGGEAMEVEGDQLDELKEEAYTNNLEQLYPLLHDKQFELKTVDGDKVDDKPTNGVKISSKGHKDITLYFDKESGLLVKSRKKAKDPSMQEVEAETYYKDYKEVNGTKQSMKQLLKHDGKKFLEAEVTDMKLLEKIDPSTFEKP